MQWFFSTSRSGPTFGSLPVCSSRSTAAPPTASPTAFGSGLRLPSVNLCLAQSRQLAQTPVQKRGCLSCLVPCYPYFHPGTRHAETVGHDFLSSFAELFFSTPYNQLEFDSCDWWSFMFLQHPLILFLLSWLWFKLLILYLTCVLMDGSGPVAHSLWAATRCTRSRTILRFLGTGLRSIKPSLKWQSKSGYSKAHNSVTILLPCMIPGKLLGG